MTPAEWKCVEYAVPGDPVGAVLAEPPFVLPHAASRARVAVLPEAVGLIDLGAAEGVRALVLRSPRRGARCVPEAAARVLRGEPALVEPELVIRRCRRRRSCPGAGSNGPSTTRSESTSSGMMKWVSA